MNTNTTAVYVEPVQEISIKPDSIKLWSLTLSMASILMFSLALIFGFISWLKIPAWRQLKNFIFLNTVIALFMINIPYVECFNRWPCCSRKMHRLNELSMTALANWTLIMCMVIYTKILKVFSGDLQHKYAKATAFAWGLAFMENYTAGTTYVDPLPVVVCMTNSVSYVVLGFYLSVDYALLKLATVRTVSKDNSIQIVKIFFYVTSACAILTLVQVKEYFSVGVCYRDELFVAISILEQIFVVSFLSMKAHRDLWREYFKTEKGQRDVLRNI